MRLVYTDKVGAGAILAKSILNEREQVLLHEGAVLTDHMLARLKELGIPVIYIKNHVNEVSELDRAISEELRKKTKKIIHDTFEKLSKQQTITGGSIVLESSSKEFIYIIRAILDEIQEHNILLDLISNIFIVDDYIFRHSFNVTLYSIAIGLKLNLSSKQLELLGLGAIFHDIGKLKVPQEILKKPGKLTEEEFGNLLR